VALLPDLGSQLKPSVIMRLEETLSAKNLGVSKTSWGDPEEPRQGEIVKAVMVGVAGVGVALQGPAGLYLFKHRDEKPHRSKKKSAARFETRAKIRRQWVLMEQKRRKVSGHGSQGRSAGNHGEIFHIEQGQKKMGKVLTEYTSTRDRHKVRGRFVCEAPLWKHIN